MLPNVELNNPHALAVDLHADTIQRVVDEGVDLGLLSAEGHLDIPRMRQGGLGAQFFSIWVNPNIYPGVHGVERAWKLITALKAQIADHSEDLELATNSEEMERIIHSRRIAAAMGIEGGHAINGSLELLEEFFLAGVRYMTLSWSNSNEICGSSGDEGNNRGLTDFGREVIRLMNRLGIMVDLSHVSDRSFFDALDVTTRPVIVSHSNFRNLCNHPRNITDDMFRALAGQGGVCGINFYTVFLDDNYYRSYLGLSDEVEKRVALAREEYAHDPVAAGLVVDRIRAEALSSLPPVSFQKVVDHIDYAVELGGIDHVGLGSDFDGIPGVPAGLEDVSKLPAITAELERRGYDQASIEKILSRNVMRVFRAATSG
jgi:membrane dipeptidase